MSSDFKNEIIAFIKTIYQGELIVDSKDKNFIEVFIKDVKCVIKFHLMNENIHENSTSHDYNCTPNKIVHLWEDQWIYQRKKLQSKILSILGKTERIHARKTIVIPIENIQLLNFLEENHLLVPIKAKHKYGLFYHNSLVAIMSFSKPRGILREGILHNSFELLRFCNKLDVTVVGGFSKLLSRFIKNKKPDDIMTYVDADWSDGKVYVKMGFQLERNMQSMEFLINPETGVREYPHLLFKRYHKYFKENFTFNDKINLLRRKGFNLVKNSGSYKYILKTSLANK